MKRALEYKTSGGKILGELHDLVEEVGQQVSMAANNAEQEMEGLRQWNRQIQKPGSFGEPAGIEARMAKAVGETLIRIGRATGAARRAALEAENLEDMAVSTLTDLWLIFTVTNQKPD